MTDYSGIDNLEVMRLARNYNRHLCETVKRHDPGTGLAIDYGAGLGTFSGCVRGDRARVLCVEPDENLRARLHAEGYRVAEAVAGIATASIQYAFSLNVLEHVPDDTAAIRDLARILEPGGRLMLFLPAFPLLFSSMDRKVGHYRRYTRADLVRLLASAGLRGSTVRYEDFLGFFATLMFKALDRERSGDLNPRALVFYDRWIFPASRLLSRAFFHGVGKNLLVVAEKPPAP